MIPDFKGHHFVEDSEPGEPPSTHHCERCGMEAMVRPDGSIFFNLRQISQGRSHSAERFVLTGLQPDPSSSGVVALVREPTSSRNRGEPT
jgi:hypothetical protein